MAMVRLPTRQSHGKANLHRFAWASETFGEPKSDLLMQAPW
jgi:hypothetical protein